MAVQYRLYSIEDVQSALCGISHLEMDDYKKEVQDLVYGLQQTALSLLPSLDERIEICNYITDHYICKMNSQPTNYILYGLGSYLLLDYIKEKYKDRNADNQFLTTKQTSRRMARELITGEDNLNYFNALYNYSIDSLHKKGSEINDYNK